VGLVVGGTIASGVTPGVMSYGVLCCLSSLANVYHPAMHALLGSLSDDWQLVQAYPAELPTARHQVPDSLLKV
jgi:hypothetical protein